MNWNELNLDIRLVKAMSEQNLEKPTEIQEAVIPALSRQQDIIMQSETGSGKTLAYLLPIYEKFKEIVPANQVIILVPTHELAIQIKKQAVLLSQNSGILIHSEVIMGNVNIERQITKLKEKPQIIIGTAGRILELIKKKKIAAHLVKMIVVDEADKLLDDHNKVSVQDVIKCTMRDRQLIFCSASMPKKAMDAAMELGNELQIIRMNRTESIPDNISHVYLVTERRDKLETFRKLAKVLDAKHAMVFINKTSDIEEAAYKLEYHKVPFACIHGANLKEDRKRAIDGFTAGKVKYLLATDIAARGLHFEDIDLVFHISIPEEPVDYLHRAGRTGRNKKPGLNILLVTKEEIKIINKYKNKFGITFTQKYLHHGVLTDEKNEPVIKDKKSDKILAGNKGKFKQKKIVQKTANIKNV